MSEAVNNIKVICRIRPCDLEQVCVVSHKESRTVVASEKPIHKSVLYSEINDHRQLNSIRSTLLEQGGTFRFDAVLPETATQEDLYRNWVETAVNAMFEGRCMAILTFGVSKSGKTYAMRGGNSENQGIILRATQSLLEICSRQRMDICLKASVYNIHGDDQVDLLTGNSGTLSETLIRSFNEIHIALHHALKKRKELGNKKFKEKSNMIVSLKLVRGTELISQSDFVELAASEYAQTDQRIARSFNSLINYLTQGAVNWRDSQLVTALRNSLDIYNGYNPSQVLLICCVNPVPSAYKATYSSLKYTSRIRECVGSEETYNRDLAMEEFEMLKRDVMRSSPPHNLADAAQWLLSREALLFKIQTQLPNTKKHEASLLKSEIEKLRFKWLEYKEEPRDSQVLITDRGDSLYNSPKHDEAIHNLHKEENIRGLKSEIQELHTKLTISQEEIDCLHLKNLQLERAKTHLEFENENYSKRLEETKSANQKQISDLQNAIHGERSILEEIRKSYSEGSAKTDRTLEEIRSTLQERELSISKLKSELDDRNRLIEKCMQEIKSLTSSMHNIKESKDNLSQQVHDLKIDLNRSKSELKNSTEKLQSIKETLNEKNAKYEQMRDKNKEIQIRNDRTINNLETRLFSYDTNKQTFEKTRFDLEKQLTQKETERQKEFYLRVQLESDIKTKEEMFNEISLKLNSKTDKLNKNKNKIKIIQDSVEKAMKDFESSTYEQINNLKTVSICKLESYIHKLISLQNIQNVYLQNQKEGKQLDIEYIVTLTKEKEDLQNIIERMRTELDAIKEEIQNQDRETSYFKDSQSMRMSISEIETAPPSHKKSPSTEVINAPNVFIHSNLSPILSTHESGSHHHNRQQSKADSLKEKAKLAISEWNSVKESQADLSSSHKFSELSSLESRCNSLVQKLRSIEKERDDLLDQIAKSSFIRSEISSIKRELDKEKQIKDSLRRENENLKSCFSMSESTNSLANRLKRSLKPAPKYDSPDASFSIHYKPLDITYPTQLEELTIEIQKLTIEKEELITRYETEAAENKLLSDHILKLQNDKTYLESSLQHSQSLISDYETLIDELRINLLESANETKKALELKLDYMRQLEDANNIILDMKRKHKTERSSNQDEYLRYKQETHRHAEVSEYTISQLETMSLELASLKSEKDQLIIEKNMLENKVRELQDPLPKLQDRISSISVYLNNLANITAKVKRDDLLFASISSDYSDSDMSHRSDEF